MAQKANVPFNVTILELTPQKLQGLKPVKVLDIFDGMSNNFHEDGLFSNSIFGKVGDPRRNARFSYIDIKLPIFHPILFRALTDLKKLYLDIIESKSYAIWNPIIKDFERSNPIDGNTGFYFFLSHWEEINFTRNRSVEREHNILLVEKYRKIALTSKVIVIPAGMRDVEVGADGRTRRDEINDFYTTFISVSNTITTSAVALSPEILNNARVKLQNNFNGLYAMIENMIKGKKKLFLGGWASRRIQNGTRNVITAQVTNNKFLNGPGSIGYNNTVMGLYQAMKGALPITKFHIRNSFIGEVFVSENQAPLLINAKTLELEPTVISNTLYSRWTTDEGIDKLITSFSEESIRHKPIMLEGHYLALVYRGEGAFKTFRVFRDINEVPEWVNKAKEITPITYCEFFYYCLYKVLNTLPVFITRYPIAGTGSIYPSITYIKTTVKGDFRKRLDDDWRPLPDSEVAYQFPITGAAFVNSFSPASSRLAGLVADFDGDTGSANFTYADESVTEVTRFLNTKKAYVGTDGKFTSSIDVSTVALVMHNLTRPD